MREGVARGEGVGGGPQIKLHRYDVINFHMHEKLFGYFFTVDQLCKHNVTVLFAKLGIHLSF